jgi:hypothetical protein
MPVKKPDILPFFNGLSRLNGLYRLTYHYFFKLGTAKIKFVTDNFKNFCDFAALCEDLYARAIFP